MRVTRKRPRASSAELERFASIIVGRFHPNRIILFGSHAEGRAGSDSDIDLLVIVSRSVSASSIRCALPDRVSIDLLVRTERQLNRRLRIGDPFFKEIVERGKVLYDARRTRVG